MNARDSLAADRIAEDAWGEVSDATFAREPRTEDLVATALVAIAAELRAARIYANYLEGREGSRSSGKRDQPTAIFRREP